MPGIIQPTPIDIASWREDEAFFRYPEGARAKRAVFPDGDSVPVFIRHNRRHMFKRSRKAYPDQYWGEVIAYHVGSRLGIEVPRCFVAWDSRTNECGALIEWFYVDGQANFVVGGQYLQQLIKDFDRDRGTQHNFQSIRVLCRVLHAQLTLGDWQLWWAKTFIFDALIGNTDRHQDNWGFLFFLDADRILRGAMAPCYDHGTSLGHERFPDLVANWAGEKFGNYITNGKHHMKWRLEDDERPGMIDMVSNLCVLYPRVRKPLRDMVVGMDLADIRAKLEHWQSFEIPVRLSPNRIDLVLKLLGKRLELLHKFFA